MSLLYAANNKGKKTHVSKNKRIGGRDFHILFSIFSVAPHAPWIVSATSSGDILQLRHVPLTYQQQQQLKANYFRSLMQAVNALPPPWTELPYQEKKYNSVTIFSNNGKHPWDYWIFWLYLSFGALKNTTEHDVSETGSVSVLRRGNGIHVFCCFRPHGHAVFHLFIWGPERIQFPTRCVL
jgi:hypothetical protein